MNFDADSGIKRRLIHFEFRNKFVAQQDLEKERLNHKIGKVYALDNALVSKFHNNDDYKNALIHILIKKAKQYFDIGLTIPDKYVEIAKEICEENGKFKSFFENHFEITNNDSDRIAKDELRDMYNSYTKCNFSASSIMTDIQRLQLNYNRGLRCMYNGVSLRGVIIGIKKLKGQQSEPVKTVYRQGLPDPDGLDAGIPCTELTDDDLIRRLKDKEEEVNDLNEQFEKMRLEFEAYKKNIQSQGYPELKLAYAEVKDRAKEMAEEKRIYYNKWYATLKKEEQKEEDERRYNQGACESENRIGKTCYENEYKKIEANLNPRPRARPPVQAVKSVLSFIDDSDDEDVGKPINTKDHKIMKAVECNILV